MNGGQENQIKRENFASHIINTYFYLCVFSVKLLSYTANTGAVTFLKSLETELMLQNLKPVLPNKSLFLSSLSRTFPVLSKNIVEKIIN
jgi:hypothetical protein